ncbi:anthranilate synthase component II [bacterium]
MKKVLLVDNYDSFSHTIANYFRVLKADVKIIQNDDPKLFAAIKKWNPQKIIISPGPKSPKESGYSPKVIQDFYKEKHILGICLGMQIINEVFGGKTERSKEPVHGKTSEIQKVNQKDQSLFKNIKMPFVAARYHSLECKNISDDLVVTSEIDDKTIMSLKHKDYNLYGIQFHPESFMSTTCKKIFENFLKL